MAGLTKKTQMLYDTMKENGADVGTPQEFQQWFFAKGEQGYKYRKQVWQLFHDNGADVGKNYEEMRDWLGLHQTSPKKSVQTQKAQQIGSDFFGSPGNTRNKTGVPSGFGQMPTAGETWQDRMRDNEIASLDNQSYGNPENPHVQAAKQRAEDLKLERDAKRGAKMKDVYGGLEQQAAINDTFDAIKGDQEAATRIGLPESMRQTKDEMDYASLTDGEMLQNEENIVPFTVNTLGRDENGNPMVNDEGEVITGFTSEEPRVAASDYYVKSAKEEHDKNELRKQTAEKVDEALKALNAGGGHSILEDIGAEEVNYGKSVGSGPTDTEGHSLSDDSFAGLDAYMERAKTRAQYNDLLAAKHLVSEAQGLMSEINKQKNSSEFENFLRNIPKGAADQSVVKGVIDFDDNRRLIAAIQQFEKDKSKLTEEQKLLLDAAAINTMVQSEYLPQMSTWSKAGQTTGGSASLMLEIAAAPLSGLGKQFSKQLTKKIFQASARRAAEKGSQYAVSTGAKRAARLATAGAYTGATALRAPLLTGTIGAPRVAADALQRMQGDIQYGYDENGEFHFAGANNQQEAIKAFRDAFVAGSIENFTEMENSMLLGGFKLASQTMPFISRVTDGLRATKLGKIYSAAGRTELGRMVRNVKERTGLHDFLGENLEEIEGGVLNALFVGDNTIQDVFKTDNLVDIGLGVAPMQMFFSAISLGGYIGVARRAKRNIKVTDANGAQQFGQDEWDKVKAAIDGSKDVNELKNVLTNVISGGQYSNEAARAAYDYARAREGYKGAVLGEAAAKNLDMEEKLAKRPSNIDVAADGQTVVQKNQNGEVISEEKFEDEEEAKAHADILKMQRAEQDFQDDLATAIEASEQRRQAVENGTPDDFPLSEDMERYVRIKALNRIIPDSVEIGSPEYEEFVRNMDTPGTAENDILLEMMDSFDPLEDAYESVSIDNDSDRNEIDKAIKTDPVKRTERQQKLVSEFAARLHQFNFPKGELHPEQSFADGQTQAELDGAGTMEADPEAMLQMKQSMDDAQQALDDAVAQNTDLAAYVNETINSNEPFAPEDVISGMIGRFSDDEIATVADYINAQSKLDGYLEYTNGKIQQYVERETSKRAFKGKLNGAPSGNMVMVTDGENQYFLVNGDVQVGENGEILSAGEANGIVVVDEEGNIIPMGLDSSLRVEMGATLEEYAASLLQQQQVNTTAQMGFEAPQENGNNESDESNGAATETQPTGNEAEQEGEKDTAYVFESKPNTQNPLRLKQEVFDEAEKANKEKADIIKDYQDRMNSETDEGKQDAIADELEEKLNLPFHLVVDWGWDGKQYNISIKARTAVENGNGFSSLNGMPTTFKVGDNVSFSHDGRAYFGKVTKVDENGKIAEAVDIDDGRIIVKDGRPLTGNEINGVSEAPQETEQEDFMSDEKVSEMDAALAKIPTRKSEKDGEPDYIWEDAPAEDTIDALAAINDGNMDAVSETATMMRKEAESELKKAEKLKTSGKNPIEMAKSRAENKQKVEEAQKRLDYWKAVEERVKELIKQAGEAPLRQAEEEDASTRAAIIEEKSDNDAKWKALHQLYDGTIADDGEILDESRPMDINELVAMNMPRNIAWESYTVDGTHVKRGLQDELGSQHTRGIGKNVGTNAFNTFLAKKGTGISIDEAIHQIWESGENELANGEKRFSDQEIRNAVIDMFLSAERPSDITNYVVNNRSRLANEKMRQEEEYMREQEANAYADAEAQARGFADADEEADYNEFIAEEIKLQAEYEQRTEEGTAEQMPPVAESAEGGEQGEGGTAESTGTEREVSLSEPGETETEGDTEIGNGDNAADGGVYLEGGESTEGVTPTPTLPEGSETAAEGEPSGTVAEKPAEQHIVDNEDKAPKGIKWSEKTTDKGYTYKNVQLGVYGNDLYIRQTGTYANNPRKEIIYKVKDYKSHSINDVLLDIIDQTDAAVPRHVEDALRYFYLANGINPNSILRPAFTPSTEEVKEEPKKERKNPSGNKLVTDERYEELKKRMRDKLLGQMNIGVDPEILALGVEMAVYHIEKGARKFAEYAKAMIEDMGDVIRPYLKAFYNGARDLPEMEELSKEMDAEVEASGNVTLDDEDDDSGTRLREAGSVFFSNAERAVEGIKQEKATPEQWLKMIEKNGGLKAGEDKWMGLSEWLKGQDKKSLTKQEVLDFIRENQIQIEEVNYNEHIDLDNNSNMRQLREEFDDSVEKFKQEKETVDAEMVAFNDEMYGKYGKGWSGKLSAADKERGEKLQARYNRLTDDPKELAFNEMVERYGDDFGMAFEVNWGNGKLEPQMDMYGDDISDAAKYFLQFEEQPINSTRLSYTTKGLENKKEIALTVPTIESWNENDAIHFGDAGKGRAVAWVRFGETTDKDGKKVLVIDEIQSKRHQDGRDNGYYDASRQETFDTAEKAYGDFLELLLDKYNVNNRNQLYDYLTPQEQTRLNGLELEMVQAQEDLGEVPDAPFRKNWHELAMKRMLRYAAENGYDKVAWTKGEQQAKRYDIGTQFDKIKVETYLYGGKTPRQEITMTGEINTVIEAENGIVVEGEYKGHSLTELFGKDLGGKIAQTENGTVYEGNSLRIGGEGMKGFYDQMLPRFMNKYGKKWGVKVGEVELPNVEEAGRKMWAVDVTPEMKESVMQGQPLFREGSAPADSQPAEKMKEHLTKLSKKIGTKVVFHDDASTITNTKVKEALQKGKTVAGWYDPKDDSVHFYMPNIKDRYEAEKTIWHEVVGHKGMRALLGEEGYRTFMRRLWMDKSEDFEEMHQWVVENYMRYGGNLYEAMDEWFAYNVVEPSVPKNLWDKVMQVLSDVLRKLGFMTTPNMKDMKYMLWLSRNAIKEGDAWTELQRNATLAKLDLESRRRASAYGKDAARARDGFANTPTGDTEREMYRNGLMRKMFAWTEAHQDYMASAKLLMDAILKGRKVLDRFNFYMKENHADSKIKIMEDLYVRDYCKPMEDAINRCVAAIGGKLSEAYEVLEDYMAMKHGLERNREFFVRDWMEEKRKKTPTIDDLDEEAKSEYESAARGIEQGFEDGTIETEEERDKELKKALEDSYSAMLDRIEEGWAAAKAQPTDNLAEWLKGLDDYIRQHIDDEYEAGKHDYSGLTSFNDNVNPNLENGYDYDDDAVVGYVMDMESKIGEENVAELWEQKGRMTQFALDIEHEAGLITDKNYDKVSQMFHWYMPLRKWDEDMAEDIWSYMNSKKNTYVGRTLMKAGGRKSRAAMPIGTMFAMGGNAISRAARNEVKKAFAGFVRMYERPAANDNDPLVTELEAWVENLGTEENPDWVYSFPDIPENATADEVREAKNAWAQHMLELMQEGRAMRVRQGDTIPYRFESKKRSRPEHIVEVYEEGQPHFFIVNDNPRAAQAINGQLKPETKHKITAQINRFMSSVFTSYSPTFMARNAFRDAEFASSMLSVKEGWDYCQKFIKNYMKVTNFVGKRPLMFSLFRKFRDGTLDESNKMECYFKEFAENGGITGYVMENNAERWEKEILAGVKEIGENQVVGITKNIIKRFMEGVEHAGEAIENAARFATYVTSRESGRTVTKSVNDAKEVSVNFNRKGAGHKTESLLNEKGEKTANNVWAAKTAQYMRANTLFYNASLQGIMNTVGNAARKPWWFAAKFAIPPMVLGALVPVFNAWVHAMLDDDDDKVSEDPYADLPEYTRRMNMCLYIGHGKFLMIPLSIEHRAFFGLGDIMAGQTYDEKLKNVDKPLAVDAVSQLTAFSPVDYNSREMGIEGVTGWGVGLVVPAYISPLVNAYFNKSWKGSQIQRENAFGGSNLPEYQKAKDYTSKTLVGASRMWHELWGGNDAIRAGHEQDSKVMEWIGEVSPAKMEYVVEQYFGEPGKLGTGVSDMFSMMFGNKEADLRKIPVVKAFATLPNENTQFRRANTKYWNYRDEFKTVELDDRQYRARIDDDAALKLEYENKFKKSKRYKQWRIYNPGKGGEGFKYKKNIEDLQKRINAEDDPVQKRGMQHEWNILVQQLVDTLDNIE